MKKILLVILFLGNVCLVSRAQEIYTGPVISAAYSQIVFSGTSPAYDATGYSIGYQAGWFLRREYDSFFLQAEINYTGNLGGNWSFNEADDQVRLSTLGLPLFAGKMTRRGLFFCAGLVPYTILQLDTEQDLEDFTPGIATERTITEQTFGVHFLVGGGADLGRISLQVRYEGGLIGGFLEDQLDKSEVIHRIPVLSLGMALKLGR